MIPERNSFVSRRCPEAVAGRDLEAGCDRLCSGGPGGRVLLHSPSRYPVDPVVRANWVQFVTPFMAYLMGRG